MSAPISEHQRTRVSQQRALWFRAYCFVGCWALKTLVATVFWLRRPPPAQRPTYTKHYAVRPKLPVHVFLPKDYSASKNGPGLPLLIDVHGGGFSIGSPKQDFPHAAAFAHEHGFAVVCLAYKMAPQQPYPGPVHDVAALIAAVLDDESLPFDRARVATIGWSAGGNLITAALQLHGLHSRVAATVPVYPAVDFAADSDLRRASRVKHPDGRADSLATFSWWFNWAYVPPGTWLADPLLSPRYAKRDLLPRSVYIVGCEYDMLCGDARNMAEDLAAQEVGDADAERQVEEIPDDGTGFADQSWHCGRVRWRLIRGVEHGFDAIAHNRRGAERELYFHKAEVLRRDIVDWLHRIAFQ